MKKIAVTAAALIGTLLFGILWLNNLVSAGRYHILLFKGAFGDTDRVPSGFWPALDWTTIDLSTVTTFIPFFGCALLLHRLLRPGAAPDAPFFVGYDRFNIALGLIGTIWGIILVGYYPADDVSIATLMRCLHTAMFSTLIAVIWVMVLMPTVIVPLLRFCSTVACSDDVELDQLLDRITVGADAAAEEFRLGAAEAAKFRNELAESARTLRELRQEAAGMRAEEQSWQRNATELLAAVAAAARELDAGFQRLKDENTTLAEANAGLDAETRQLKTANTTLTGRNAELDADARWLKDENAVLAERSEKLDRQCAQSERALQDMQRTLEQIRSALR